jgi:hypothetical protein
LWADHQGKAFAGECRLSTEIRSWKLSFPQAPLFNALFLFLEH